MSLLTRLVRNVSLLRYSNRVTVYSVTKSVQESSRHFSFNSKLCIKMYLENENKYAYNIMRDKGFAIDIEKNIKSEILDKEQFEKLLQEDWSKRTPAQIFEAFPKLGVYCKQNNMCISNSIFDNFIDNLTDNLHKATNDELISVFYSVTEWPETKSIRTRNFIEVWTALDDVCLQRLNSWSLDEILTFTSLFYMINIAKVSDSTTKGLNKLAGKAKRLTPEQLVKTLFFVGIQRTSPFDIHGLELRLETLFPMFSIDDVAIMSMGLFKSKTPIRSPMLVNKIINLILNNLQTVHEVSLAALLKIIRYSAKIPHPDTMVMVTKLFDALLNEIPRLSVMCNVHIALLGMSKLILHKDCLDAIAEATIRYRSQTRLKDLERLALSYGTFRYIPQTKQNFFNIIIEELRDPQREMEIKLHGRSFACCVQYLCLLGLHPVDLMNKALSKDFLNSTYGKQPHGYGREILNISNTAKIFCSNEQVNVLTDKESRILAKRYTDYIPSTNFKKQYNTAEKMMLDVMKTLSKMRGGDEFITGDHILTHHQRGDVILCNSPEGKALAVTNKFTFGVIHHPPDDNIWVVLVIAGRNGLIQGCLTPTAPFLVKIEELRQIGYHANMVLWNIYNSFETYEDKAKYLTECINEAVKHKNKNV